MEKEIEPRECPNCHEKVSRKICAEYFRYGTAHTVRCNHCGTRLSPVKEPVPFNICCIAGFLSAVIPAEICLQFLHRGIIESLLVGWLFGSVALIIIMILTLKRIRFKKHFE